MNFFMGIGELATRLLQTYSFCRMFIMTMRALQDFNDGAAAQNARAQGTEPNANPPAPGAGGAPQAVPNQVMLQPQPIVQQIPFYLGQPLQPPLPPSLITHIRRDVFNNMGFFRAQTTRENIRQDIGDTPRLPATHPPASSQELELATSTALIPFSNINQTLGEVRSSEGHGKVPLLQESYIPPDPSELPRSDRYMLIGGGSSGWRICAPPSATVPDDSPLRRLEHDANERVHILEVLRPDKRVQPNFRYFTLFGVEAGYNPEIIALDLRECLDPTQPFPAHGIAFQIHNQPLPASTLVEKSSSTLEDRKSFSYEAPSSEFDKGNYSYRRYDGEGGSGSGAAPVYTVHESVFAPWDELFSDGFIAKKEILNSSHLFDPLGTQTKFAASRLGDCVNKPDTSVKKGFLATEGCSMDVHSYVLRSPADLLAVSSGVSLLGLAFVIFSVFTKVQSNIRTKTQSASSNFVFWPWQQITFVCLLEAKNSQECGLPPRGEGVQGEPKPPCDVMVSNDTVSRNSQVLNFLLRIVLLNLLLFFSLASPVQAARGSRNVPVAEVIAHKWKSVLGWDQAERAAAEAKLKEEQRIQDIKSKLKKEKALALTVGYKPKLGIDAGVDFIAPENAVGNRAFGFPTRMSFQGYWLNNKLEGSGRVRALVANANTTWSPLFGAYAELSYQKFLSTGKLFTRIDEAIDNDPAEMKQEIRQYKNIRMSLNSSDRKIVVMGRCQTLAENKVFNPLVGLDLIIDPVKRTILFKAGVGVRTQALWWSLGTTANEQRSQALVNYRNPNRRWPNNLPGVSVGIGVEIDITPGSDSKPPKKR